VTERTEADIAAPQPTAAGWWGFAAIILYTILALLASGVSASEGHPEALLALLAVPIAIVGRSRTWLFAAANIIGGVWLRIAYTQFGDLTDQLIVSQAAFDVLLAGGNPYGIGYAESVPPGAPYPYGPLAMLWAPTWIWGEIIFGAATLVVIAWTRSWLTLSFYAAHWTIVDLSTAGLNDVTPGFFITAGVLALKYKPWLGAVLIAIAAGFKPYAAAWFPGVIAVGGLRNLGVLVLSSLVVWLPAWVAWGPLSMIRSFELARDVHPVSENALNVPMARLLAVPIAIVALFLKPWWAAGITGLAIFLIVLFFDFWASIGYLVAIAPITGILIEMGIRNLQQRRDGTLDDAAPEASAVA
jgi:hypothetical protein